MIASIISSVPNEQLAEFCGRWRIRELSLFGSALRDDFGPDSDLDVLVSFAPEADWSLLDHIQMQLELERLFHRRVDLMTRRALEHSQNLRLREQILSTAQPLFPPHEAFDVAR